MAVNTKANLGIYRSDVRTPGARIVDDSAIMVVDNDQAITTKQQYYMRNHKMNLVVEIQRLAYNVAHPDT